jgi:hypothetical protein
MEDNCCPRFVHVLAHYLHSFLRSTLDVVVQAFKSACDEVDQKVTLRYQDGYDHSYYFISTFMQDHVQFHAQRLHN